MDPVSIGKRIRTLRGMESQQTLADKLKISKSALAMYERGERIPRDEVKVRIAQHFNVSLESIFLHQVSTNSAELGGLHMKARHERAGVPALTPTQLPIFEHQGQLVADSRDVAVMLERSHGHLVRSIRTYCGYLNQSKIGSVEFFIPST